MSSAGRAQADNVPGENMRAAGSPLFASVAAGRELEASLVYAGLACAVVTVLWWCVLMLTRRKRPYPYLFQICAALAGATLLYILASLLLMPPKPFH